MENITVTEFQVDRKPIKQSELLAYMEQQLKQNMFAFDKIREDNRNKELQISALQKQNEELMKQLETQREWMKQEAQILSKAQGELEKYDEMGYPELYYKYMRLQNEAREYYLMTKQEQEQEEYDWLKVAKAVGIVALD